MRKIYVLTAFLIALSLNTEAQKKKPAPIPNSSGAVDSSQEVNSKEELSDNIPIITLDENELSDGSTQNISSVLTAGKDPFYSATSYNFSPVRFRMRGYDADNFVTYMNGVPMENLDNGFTPFGLWGGLNDVMHNKDFSIGLRNNSFSFGGIGTSTSFDSRASKQRKQSSLSYAITNTNYTHKLAFTHSSGMNKNGWAYTFSASRRYADEGYVEGTYYDSWSYFIGVDKRINQKNTLSLVVFGAPTENGRQGPVTEECFKITNNKFYNPYWGYQMGKKRNARVGKSDIPVAILTHDFKINSTTTLITAISYSQGEKSISNIDFFNAANPSPDYYRYLPSYFVDDSARMAAVTSQWQNDVNTRQIDWNKLYMLNRSGTDSFAGHKGNRSHYILSDAVTATKSFNFNTVLNKRITDKFNVTAGASYQSLVNHYYKRVEDLLGGDYYMDLNQFVPYDNNGNADTIIQNDANNPNRAVHVGDDYGYNYEIHINKADVFAVGSYKFNNLDVFFGGEFSNTQFWRNGLYRNGLFNSGSYGKSSVNEFNNYALKGGLTYKINGRNYVYLNESYSTNAPYFANVYLSPRTRDTKQDRVTSEKINSMEAGYIYSSPNVKMRLSSYYTEFNDGMNVLVYFDDGYSSLVNYAISNINKVHYGGEFGVEVKPIKNIVVQAAAAIGKYYYSGRQYSVTTIDNTAAIQGADTIYSKNYNVGGTPQQAYNLGITYRSPNYWYVGISGSYFDQMWLDINPIRRTYRAANDFPNPSPGRDNLLKQTQLSSQYLVDFNAGCSFKLPNSMKISKNNSFLNFNLGINNILNNTGVYSGGFEQLRYDFKGLENDKFPNKYFRYYGINYHFSVAYRF